MAVPKRHLIIPDTQVRPGVPTDNMDWIGAAVVRYEPDVVIHLGDHWDMPSLSSYASLREIEGQSYRADIDAGNDALLRLHKAMDGWEGRKVLLRGNHEQRIERAVNANPRLVGTIGYHDFNDRELGWEIVDYVHGSPGIIEIDGVAYSHYFANPNTGKPIGGTINNRMAKIGSSFVQGHVQGLLQGNIQYATGKVRHGIVCGSSYAHDESYRGMANTHWRGIVVLNEVRNGEFCEMPLTLDYLCRQATGMSVARYLQRRYRNAKHRFVIAAQKG